MCRALACALATHLTVLPVVPCEEQHVAQLRLLRVVLVLRLHTDARP